MSLTTSFSSSGSGEAHRGWVKVQWDTTTTLLPAETSYDELCIHNPFGEMFDRRLHLNGEPLPFEGPIELKDGDTLLSVPRGYY